jgi:hypothetical protein
MLHQLDCAYVLLQQCNAGHAVYHSHKKWSCPVLKHYTMKVYAVLRKPPHVLLLQ